MSSSPVGPEIVAVTVWEAPGSRVKVVGLMDTVAGEDDRGTGPFSGRIVPAWMVKAVPAGI